MSKKKQNYNRIKTIRIILHLVPFLMGMVGLYVLSSWSIGIRVEHDLHYNEGVYYFGFSLMLIALLVPVFIELYRGHTKKFILHRVVIASVCLIFALFVAAINLVQKIDISDDDVIEFDLFD